MPFFPNPRKWVPTKLNEFTVLCDHDHDGPRKRIIINDNSN